MRRAPDKKDGMCLLMFFLCCVAPQIVISLSLTPAELQLIIAWARMLPVGMSRCPSACRDGAMKGHTQSEYECVCVCLCCVRANAQAFSTDNLEEAESGKRENRKT